MRYLYCLLCILSSIACASADSVVGSIAHLETDFTYTINDAPLVVFSQGITTRTVREDRKLKGHELSVPSVVAYQAYHLELAFKLESIDKRKFKAVEFYMGHELLHRIDLTKVGRLMTVTEGPRFDVNFLGVNLRGTPLALLDSIDRINLVKD